MHFQACIRGLGMCPPWVGGATVFETHHKEPDSTDSKENVNLRAERSKHQEGGFLSGGEQEGL